MQYSIKYNTIPIQYSIQYHTHYYTTIIIQCYAVLHHKMQKIQHDPIQLMI